MSQKEKNMKDYKVTIVVSDVGGVYSANSIEEVEEIAEEECNEIYDKLNGRCSVCVDSIEEINK